MSARANEPRRCVRGPLACKTKSASGVLPQRLAAGGCWIFFCPGATFEETGYFNVGERAHAVAPRGELSNLGGHEPHLAHRDEGRLGWIVIGHSITRAETVNRAWCEDVVWISLFFVKEINI